MDGGDHVTRDRQRNAVRYPDGTLAVQEREVLTISRRPWAPASARSSLAPSGLLAHLQELLWFIGGIHFLLAVGVAGALVAHAIGRSEVLGYLGALVAFWFFFVRTKS
jgi:hypothetical protein